MNTEHLAERLDRPADYGSVDRSDMLPHIDGLPEQLLDAWQLWQSSDLPAPTEPPDGLVVAGMGGSAIAGDVLKVVLGYEVSVPVEVWRGYSLPGWVTSRTLVIASSFSGHTEETLSAFSQAVQRGARVYALTTGGRLAALARLHETGLLTYGFDGQPRAALGYSLAGLLRLVQAVQLADDQSVSVERAVDVMRSQRDELRPGVITDRNPAKRLAMQLMGRLPVVWSGAVLEPAARRWKTQLNENAKVWAAWESLPELHHNSVVGLEQPSRPLAQSFVILLESPSEHERIGRRLRLSADVLRSRGLQHWRLAAPAGDRLAQLLAVIHFGDYVSYYLAIAYGIDPTPVRAIDELKARLGAWPADSG
jgi:glucose/mannose-6-phosphate isomerase